MKWKDVPRWFSWLLRRRIYQAMKASSPIPMRVAATETPAISPLLNPLWEDVSMTGEDVAEG